MQKHFFMISFIRS